MAAQHHTSTIGQADERFQLFAEKMKKKGIAPVVMNTFMHYYGLLIQGETGLISREEIDPVAESEIADVKKLSGLEAAGQAALEKSVVIKLNGGLGTSMGLHRAKSLLTAKDGLTFLDIIARQILAYRGRHGVRLPVIFMNSFSTEADTLEALSPYDNLPVNGIPLSFLQHKFPKVLHDGLLPAAWPAEPDLEWNPPGHGDIYTALSTSGILKKLLDRGIVYAFISNSDNLAAVMDKTVLGYFAKNGFGFLMEVTSRTDADSKGGHLARLKNGRLTLREIAQCPEDEIDEFKDVNVYRYFNTNTIWVNLEALREMLQVHKNVIPLAMVRNPKSLDPRDESSPPVYQLETAMGSAVSIFENASAIQVPRARFAPVKKCQDLLALWSDCYVLADDNRVIQNPARKLGAPILRLDSRYYKRIDQLKARFPHGAPSLLECSSLDVRGDVVFGKGVAIRGEVVIANDAEAQVTVPDGSVVEKDMLFREA